MAQEVSKHIIDRIKIKDKSKITLRNIKRKFGNPTDYIEFHIYDMADAYLDSGIIALGSGLSAALSTQVEGGSIPSELETHLRETEIRMSLETAHYIAAINKESEDNRRTRIDYDVAEGLQPNQALRLYVQGKNYTDTRQQKLISYGDEIINSESVEL